MIIDADSHWAPGPDVFSTVKDTAWYIQYQQNNAAFFQDIDFYLRCHADCLKIDRQLLNFYGPSCGLRYSNIDPGLARTIASLYNSHMANLCSTHREFDYNAWLPMQDVGYCEAMIQDNNVQDSFALHLGEQVPWGFLGPYRELLGLIFDSGLPIYLHFADHYDLPADWNTDSDPLLTIFQQKYPQKKNCGVGQSDTWRSTVASLILSGLLERYQARIIIAEQGIAWIPRFVEDMKLLAGVDVMPYLQEFFWFTIEPEELDFLDTANTVGFDRLLFATDWPHGDTDIGGQHMYQDTNLLIKMLERSTITQTQFDLVTHQNYIRLKNRT